MKTFNIGDIVTFYFISRKKKGKIIDLLSDGRFMVKEFYTDILYRFFPNDLNYEKQ